MTGRCRRRQRGEWGSVTVMSIGFMIVVGLVTVVVVNASAAFLEKAELNNLADGAALAAADGLDEARFYTTLDVRLDASQARALTEDYLAGREVRGVEVSVRGDEVTVRLDRPVDLALAPPGWFDSTVVVAEATSQLRQDLGP